MVGKKRKTVIRKTLKGGTGKNTEKLKGQQYLEHVRARRVFLTNAHETTGTSIIKTINNYKTRLNLKSFTHGSHFTIHTSVSIFSNQRKHTLKYRRDEKNWEMFFSL